jgi:hypothetical protein
VLGLLVGITERIAIPLNNMRQLRID